MFINTFILLILVNSAFCFNSTRIIEALTNLNIDWSIIKSELVQGSLHDGHISTDDYETLMADLENEFPYISHQNIGKTLGDNDITIYALSIPNLPLQQKPGILITSLHHAREVATLQMNLYLFLNLIYKKERQDISTMHLIDTTVIWMHPFVNIDGYNFVEKKLDDKNHPELRKNMNYENETNSCSLQKQGVDLNRNYGYKFGLDNSGSSNDKCDEQYRGTSAFSEKETQAIKNFLDSNENVKMNLNLHCFGNLWIIPYNYYNDINNSDLKNTSLAYEVYREFNKSLKAERQKLGNAKFTIEYVANGEASDWMLHEKNIIALSPELGKQNYDQLSDIRNFYPNKEQTLELFEDDSEQLLGYIEFLQFMPIYLGTYQNRVEVEKFLERQNIEIVQVEYRNRGVSDFGELSINNDTIEIEIKNENIKIEKVLLEIKNEYDVKIQDEQHFFELSNEMELMKIKGNSRDQYMIPILKGRQYFRISLVMEVDNKNSQEKNEIVIKWITNANVFQESRLIMKTRFYKEESQEGWNIEELFLRYYYVGIIVFLLLVIGIKKMSKSKSEISEQDKKKLFKENINKIFKVDEEF